MKCPNCQYDSPLGAKYCEQCGAPIARLCAGCGSPLAERAKFCPACGQPVPAAAPQPQPEAAVQSAALPGERRQATILFADISGYTTLCASTDAEQIQALLARFYQLMDNTVAAYGGSVIDHAGDGVMAVFGAPTAYGNDAERAVRAALDMQRAAAELIDPQGRPLRLHTGIASGEVVAAVIAGGATRKYTVTGDAVNLAARLDTLAASGETLISDAVYRSVANAAEAVDLGERSVKGLEAPVRVWRIEALRPASAELQPFVGRRNELRQLEGLLQTVAETGAGMAVAVRGDPGIGKSRLVEELRLRAQQQHYACHLGRVFDFGVSKAEGALATITAQLMGLHGSPCSETRGEGMARALREGLAAAEHETFLSEVLDIPKREELQAVFDALDNATRLRRSAEAVCELSRRAAQRQPRLIVFEDVHWGSSELLGCLAALSMTASQCPLVLLMTTRFEGDPLDRNWRAASHGSPLLSIDLAPLRPADARLLAGELIEASNRFALQCIERAEGNPLFLQQLLSNARESEAASIPPTIQSLVLARMDRLGPRDKLALQAASIVGKRFPLDAVRFLIGEDQYDCQLLLVSGLVHPDRGDYLFAHALIQEGVYSSLLNARKRELHARAGQWYAGRDSALHAEHLDRALDPAAAEAYLRAAEEDRGRLRYESALKLAERGLELVQDAATRHALGMLRGDVLRETARTQESIAQLREAAAGAQDDAQRALAFIGLAAGLRITGEIPEALETLAHAQPIAERLALDTLCSRIHHMRGNVYFQKGKVSACAAEHQAALAYAQRAHDAECEANALSGLGDAFYAEGRMRTALGYFQRSVGMFKELGSLRSEIVNRLMIGLCQSHFAEADEGLREVRAASTLSQQLGLAQVEVMAQETLALVLFERGEHAEAQKLLEAAIPAARAADARRFLTVDLIVLASVLISQGHRTEARRHLDEALALGQQVGHGFIGAAAYGALALAVDSPAERRHALREGEALLAAGSLAHASIAFYNYAIHAALLDRDWDEALRYTAALESCTSAEPFVRGRLAVARARALVALGQKLPTEQSLESLNGLRTELLGAGMGLQVQRLDSLLASWGM